MPRHESFKASAVARERKRAQHAAMLFLVAASAAMPLLQLDAGFDDTDGGDLGGLAFDGLLSVTMLLFYGRLYKLRTLQTTRYVPGARGRSIPRTNALYELIRDRAPDSERKSYHRLPSKAEVRATDLILEHAAYIFEHDGPGRPQIDFQKQVHIGLFRLGHFGNAASVVKVASIYGVSTGTVVNCTARVVLALNIVAPFVIKWPSAAERDLSAKFAEEEYGFEGCIGSVDGTTIPLYSAPGAKPWSFFDRKHRYSVHALVVCDHDYRVLDLTVGWKGPASDCRVQRETTWERDPQIFFSAGQYLLGDKGMWQSLQCVMPCRGADGADPDNANFSRQLARLRIVVEQVMGLVKQRFMSLNGVRLRVDSEDDMESVQSWIIACFSLHNIVAKVGELEKNKLLSVEVAPQVIEGSYAGPGTPEAVHQANIRDKVVAFMHSAGEYIA